MRKETIAIVDDLETDLAEARGAVISCLREYGISMDVELFHSGEAFLEQSIRGHMRS